MRRAPVYLLIDTSGSMHGEPIIAVQNGMKTCLDVLRTDPECLEKVYVSIITFSDKANLLMPLTHIQDISTIPELTAVGETAMGKAIELLNEQLEKDIVMNTADSKGDYKAFGMLLTDGYPTDTDVLKEAIKKINRHKISYFIAATTMESSKETLKQITSSDTVIYLPAASSTVFKEYFKWFSQSVSNSVSKSVGGDNHGDGTSGSLGELPPLPNFDNDDELIL